MRSPSTGGHWEKIDNPLSSSFVEVYSEIMRVDSQENGRVFWTTVNGTQTLNRKGDDHGYLYL